MRYGSSRSKCGCNYFAAAGEKKNKKGKQVERVKLSGEHGEVIK